MTLEILHPLTIRLDGHTIQYAVGDQIDLPTLQGQRLLEQAGPKVRRAEPLQSQWLAAWDKLATLTDGIEKTDPRFMPVLAALEHCDAAFEQDNWGLFREAAKAVHRIVKEGQPRGRNEQ